MMSPFDLGALIFLFAAIVGYLNDRHFHLPRPIALLLGALLVSLGIIIVGALSPAHDIRELAQRRIDGAHLPHVLLDGVLALLLFAAAFHLDLRDMRSQIWAVFGLSTDSDWCRRRGSPPPRESDFDRPPQRLIAVGTPP